jgi:hypothetical protein
MNRPASAAEPRAPLPAMVLVLRAALLAALLALLLIRPDEPPPDRPALQLEGHAADAGPLIEAIMAPDPPPAVLRPAGLAPEEGELDLVAAVARRAPVTVELPGPGAHLRVDAPHAPVAGRAAALSFEGAGLAGEDAGLAAEGAELATEDTGLAADGAGLAAEPAVVRLLGPGDVVLDSVRATPDDRGRIHGAFRVRPERPGWTEWRVAAGPQPVVAAAWVAPADPPRVLVVAGAPSWESRAVLRALERSGVELTAVQALGRGQVVTAGDPAARWWEPESLARHDVVLLLPGAAPSPAALASLARHVADGHGVLVAGGAGLLELGLASSTGPERTVDPASLVWSAPPELAPLPGNEDAAAGGPGSDLAAVPLRGLSPGAAVAARTEAGDTLLVLASFGRGRAAGLGIRETWRWTLVAGQEAEHREFWRSLVDWLAAPLADAGVSAVPSTAAAPATVTVVERWPGSAAAGEGVAVRRPDGLVVTATGPVTRFVALDTGLHHVEVNGRARDAFRAVGPGDAPPAALGRARLSLAAATSGGGALEPDSFRAASRQLGAATARGQGAWLGLLFGVLAAMAIAEWTLRRLRGLP